MKFFRQGYWSGLPFPTPGGSSQSKDQIHVSCVAYVDRWILHHYAMWEAHPIRLEWLKSKTVTTLNTAKNVEQQVLSFIVGRDAKWFS